MFGDSGQDPILYWGFGSCFNRCQTRQNTVMGLSVTEIVSNLCSGM